MEPLKFYNSFKHYYVYDSDDNFIDCGTYFNLINRLEIPEKTFKATISKSNRNTKPNTKYNIVPYDEDDTEDLASFYNNLKEISQKELNKTAITDILELSEALGYSQLFVNEQIKGKTMDMFKFLYHMPKTHAKTLIYLGYSALISGNGFKLKEISEYYDLPLWLIEYVNTNQDRLFN